MPAWNPEWRVGEVAAGCAPSLPRSTGEPSNVGNDIGHLLVAGERIPVSTVGSETDAGSCGPVTWRRLRTAESQELPGRLNVVKGT
jgi:hypothetical protein